MQGHRSAWATYCADLKANATKADDLHYVSENTSVSH